MGILIAPSLKPSGEDLGRLPELRVGDFPGDLVAKTVLAGQGGPGFDPWSGNEIPHAATKIKCRKIN